MKKVKEIVDAMRQVPLSQNKLTGMLTDKDALKSVYVQLHDGTKIRLDVSGVSVIG